jgi:hypothetical protein
VYTIPAFLAEIFFLVKAVSVIICGIRDEALIIDISTEFDACFDESAVS